MATVSATVTVDDEGVVRGLRTMGNEFENVGESADDMAEGVEGAEESAADAASRFEMFTSEVQEATTVTEGYSNAQMQLVEQGRDVVQGFDRQADAVEQISRETQTLRSQSSKYNQIIFSTGDLVQDLQFGLQGAANNIAFMAEQMAESSSQAGGFGAMIKGVGSSLWGPAGMILGLQAILALGPQLASWFTSRTDEAEDFKSEIEDAAEGMFTIQQEIAGVEVETLEQAEGAVERLNSQVSSTQDEVNALSDIETAFEFDFVSEVVGGESGREEVIEDLNEMFGLSISGATEAMAREESLVEMVREEKAARETTLSTQKEARKEAENTVAAFRARQELQDAFTAAGAEIQGQQDDTNAAVREWENTLREIERIQNRILVQTEDISFEESLDIDASDLITSVQGAEEAIGSGLVQSIEGADGVISMLDERLKEATSDEQRNRIRAVRDHFIGLRNEMQKGEKEAQDFSDVWESLDKQRILAKALTDNFTELGQAIGKGERVMKSFGKAALGVLSSIGTMMGKQLIAQGSAMIASSIFGDASNAAKGAALVAAGSALVASSQALSSAIQEDQGGGQGTTGSEDNEPRGGGQVGVEASRQFGGPVQAGSMYETHGLGDREFFIPRMDGSVLTQNQVESATGRRRGGRDVRVQVDNRLEGNISGPDLFELDTRLRNVSQFKEEFARE